MVLAIVISSVSACADSYVLDACAQHVYTIQDL